MNNVFEFLKNNSSLEKGMFFLKSADDRRYASYKDFIKKVSCVLGFLQSFGVKPKDEVVFQIEDTYKFLLLFWACVMGGIIPVPVLVGNNDEHKKKVIKIWNALKNPYIAIEEGNLERLREDFKKIDSESVLSKNFDKKSFAVERAVDSTIEGIEFNSKENDICFIQFSSGSTGDPKGVTLTHKNLITNTGDIIEYAGIKNDDTVLNWMPLTHDMGLIGCHLSTTRMGMNQFIMPTSLFARRPLMWLDIIESEKISVSCSPNFGYKLVLKYWEKKKKRDSSLTYDLSSLRLLFNGAEPISYELETEFLNEFANYGLNKSCMMNVYGLAEASLAVCFPKPAEEIKCYDIERESLKIGERVIFADAESSSTVKLVEVGRPIGKQQVKIVDDNGQDAHEETTGYILIKGDNVTKGYYENAEATANAITENGFLNTGDVGFIRNSSLIVTGRAKDIIFVNGQNYYPPDLENICEGIDNIELNTVAACGVRLAGSERDYIAIFVVFHGNNEEFAQVAWDIKRTLQKAAGIDVDYVVPVLKLPKTTSGKLQRFSLGKKLENGEFDAVIEEINAALEAKKKQMLALIGEREFESKTQLKLAELCAEYVDVSSGDVNDNFSQLGFTSMTLVRLAEDIKTEFDKKIMVPDLFAYPTIKKMAEFIDDKNSLVIRKNIFKEDYVLKGSTETVPQEFEMDIATEFDSIVSSFLTEAINDRIYAIYKKHDNLMDCVRVEGKAEAVLESFTEESIERAKLSYYEKGFSVLIIDGDSAENADKFFDIVIEKIKTRHGDIAVFTFYNGLIDAKKLCDKI